MTMHNLVHCHVCPLKECCLYSEKDASYRWHNQGRFYAPNLRIIPKEDDFVKVQKATLNCPLKAMLQDWQYQKLRQLQAT